MHLVLQKPSDTLEAAGYEFERIVVVGDVRGKYTHGGIRTVSVRNRV